VPAYFSPTKRLFGNPFATYWRVMANRIYNSLRTAIIIMNPASGPNTTKDPNYQKAIDYCQSRLQDVVGYVHTKYGSRPLDEVKIDIERYYLFYPNIRGIFVDTMSNNETMSDYYQDLYAHVKDKSPTALVVGNPGIAAANPWQVTPPIVADILVVFEGPYERVEENERQYKDWSPPEWVTSRPARYFANLIYESPSRDMTTSICIASMGKNAGWIYVTRDTRQPGRLWDELPDTTLIASPTLYRRSVLAPQ
jgi:hypothetical protein